MCSCIPPPASLRARKIYNLLVPDVFGSEEPPLVGPISTGTKRKIGKLQEYVARNPSKAAKVSRRLTRRIKKALYDRHLGYVRVAVAAFCQLLDESSTEGSSYTFSYFNKELIHQPDTVIKSLLSYGVPQVQALGAQLLASYIRAQSEVEHQAAINADLLEGVVRPTKAGAAARTNADAAGVAMDQAVQEARLSAVSEYVSFCHRLKILPALLERIETRLLDSLEQEITGPGWQQVLEPLPGAVPATSVGSEVVGSVSLSASGPSFSAMRRAVAILRNFKPFLQDTGSVRRVVGALLQWLDVDKRWDNEALVQGLMRVVRDACGPLTYPLTSALLRHCAQEPSLGPRQRAAVARLAVQQGSVYSLSAFNIALLELPRALAACQASSAQDVEGCKELSVAAREVCQALAVEVGHAGQVSEALATVLRGMLQPQGRISSPEVQAHTLQCALASVQALSDLPTQGRSKPGDTLPPSLLSALAAAGGGPTGALLRGTAAELAAAAIGSGDCRPRDERQASVLLALGADVVLQGGCPSPREAAATSCLLHTALRTSGAGRAAVALGATRVALQLGAAAAGIQGMEPAAVRLAAVQTMLAYAVMRELAGLIGCEQLVDLQAPLSEANAAVPELCRRSDHFLQAVADSWGQEGPSKAAAQQAASMPPTLALWTTGCVAALCSGHNLLTQEYGVGLATLLSQPCPTLTTSAPPTFTATPTAQSAPTPFGGSTASATGHAGWGARQASVRRGQLDVARVVDLLGGSDSEETMDRVAEDDPSADAGNDVVAAALYGAVGIPLAGGQEAGRPAATSLADVLALIAKAECENGLQPSSLSGVNTGMSAAELVRSLEPLVF